MQALVVVQALGGASPWMHGAQRLVAHALQQEKVAGLTTRLVLLERAEVGGILADERVQLGRRWRTGR